MKRFTIIGACILASIITMFSFSNNSEKNAINSEISEEDIYATITFECGDAVIDMDDISEVYDFADLVVVGTITERSDATMSSISALPYTPGKIEINKVLKGESVDDEVTFIMPGGTCTVEQFINGNKNLSERSEKMGLNKLTKSEKQNKYIKYVYDRFIDFEVGKEYVIMLKKSSGKDFSVISNVGFIELTDKTATNSINSVDDIININSKTVK